MKIALAVLALLLLAACTSNDARPRASNTASAAGEGLIGSLAQVSDVRPGLPVLVFVYTDG